MKRKMVLLVATFALFALLLPSAQAYVPPGNPIHGDVYLVPGEHLIGKTVHGNVYASGGVDYDNWQEIKGCTIHGDIEVKDGSWIAIYDCTIDGDIEVKDWEWCDIVFCRIDGNIKVEEASTNIRINENTIKHGSIEIKSSTGYFLINTNTLKKGNIEASEVSVITVAQNTLKKGHIRLTNCDIYVNPDIGGMFRWNYLKKGNIELKGCSNVPDDVCVVNTVVKGICEVK